MSKSYIRKKKLKKFNTFEELLEFGIKQLKTPEINVTGLEWGLLDNELYLNQMIELNNFVYTTASTNFYNGDCLWIVFNCPLSVAKFITTQVKKFNFWYTIFDVNNKLIDSFIDESKRLPDTISMQIRKETDELDRHKLYSEESPGWIIEEKYKYLISSPHLLQKININTTSCESSAYTNKDLYNSVNPIVEVTIEDPTSGNNILYQVLLDIFNNKQTIFEKLK